MADAIGRNGYGVPLAVPLVSGELARPLGDGELNVLAVRQIPVNERLGGFQELVASL